jgi:DHA1 family bicyclomycin/chloramphenicol resistance-like MFS transporter
MSHPPLSQFAHAPILVLITAMLMMQPLSTDLYLASLPTLVTDFGVPVATVQLTLSLFVVGFGGAQLIVGPLSDRFGRRPVLLGGLGIYLLASILCGLSRLVPSIVPPTVRIPASVGLSSMTNRFCAKPRNPSRKPRTSQP